MREFVVLIHGFPDTSESFRGLSKYLSQRFPSFGIIRLDLPGYNDTEKLESYDITNVALAVMRNLETKHKVHYSSSSRAPFLHLVGHDWGSLVAQKLIQLFPHLFTSLCVLSVPLMIMPEIAYSLQRGNRQVLNSWYMIYFQLPWFPEYWLSRGDGVRVLFKLWSPTWNPIDNLKDDYDHHVRDVEAAMSDKSVAFAAISYYRDNLPVPTSSIIGRLLLIIIYPFILCLGGLCYTFSWFARLNPCYIFTFITWLLEKHPLFISIPSNLPILSIVGKDDCCIDDSLFELGHLRRQKVDEQPNHLERVMTIADVGHWPHLEKPSLVNEFIANHIEHHSTSKENQSNDSNRKKER